MDLLQFNDFVALTRENVIPNREVVNLSLARNNILAELAKGKSDEELFQGGKKILVNLQTRSGVPTQLITPGDERTIASADLTSSIEVPWRFLTGHFMYTEQEITFNRGGDKVQLYDLLKLKRRAADQRLYEDMESLLFATPNYATMEATGGKAPLSIPCFITDDGALPIGFTTLMGKDLTALPMWKNQTAEYSSADHTTVIPAFTKMKRLLTWDNVAPVVNLGAQNTNWQRLMILTNADGYDLMDHIRREHQGANVQITNTNVQNIGLGAGALSFDGIPIKYVSKLDSYGWTASKPKFMFLDTAYLHPVWHTELYMKERAPMVASARQPDTFVVWNDTSYNLVCTDRQRLGCISPSDD